MTSLGPTETKDDIQGRFLRQEWTPSIISFKNSYHGSTQGALSIMGSEYWQQAFRPLLPDILQLNYNNFEDLLQITERTACVVAETIQAEAGIKPPINNWLQANPKSPPQPAGGESLAAAALKLLSPNR